MTALPAVSAVKTQGGEQWTTAWERALPILALVGPASWFVAAVVRAAGLGTLDGDLDWASRPEGLIMALGAPFFVATFIFMGRRLADSAVRAGIAVTALGVLGVAPLAFIPGFRLTMAQFIDAGFEPNALNDAFETLSAWDVGLFVLNLGGFVAWIIAGVVILRTEIAPKWVGASLILGVASVFTAQALYIALEFFWPLGTGLWLAGVWGVVRASGAWPIPLIVRQDR
jgi:hypothetical protein